MGLRRKARERAIQALYQLDGLGSSPVWRLAPSQWYPRRRWIRSPRSRRRVPSTFAGRLLRSRSRDFENAGNHRPRLVRL